jgi:hypothetical protein
VNLIKPKAKGSLKERKEKCPKKANLSIALFDRDDTVCESVCSEPKAVRCDNKENIGPLRRDRSKKMLINVGKQGSIFLSKTNLHSQTPTMHQKTQRGTPLSYQNSECSSRNGSECGIRIPSECSIKKTEEKPLKKAPSRGR